jgi:hypothetical protein
MVSPLPRQTDFASVEAAAPAFAAKQNEILALIGAMGLGWSNNESMFVYVLMLLLDTDDLRAAIVFSGLNTTRARIDLIRRLAIVTISDPAIAQTLTRLMKKFDLCTQIRNEFNHCVYDLNEHGEITDTRSMRVEERRNALSVGASRPMDEERLKEIKDTNRQLKRLNRDLWAFLPILKSHLDARKARVGDSRHD